MLVYLGADHKGFELKNAIREHLHHKGINFEDKGAISADPDDDYPQYAYAVATEVLGGDEETRGILVCGSGVGMSIAANRVRGIRAGLVWSPAEARAARRDDDINVLVLAADMIDVDTAMAIIDDFIEEKFDGKERHKRRLEQIEELYG